MAGPSHGVGVPEERQVVAGEGLPEDLVLRVEAVGDGEAGDGHRGDQVGPAGDGHVLLQPAHLPHVLLVVAAQDHRARPEEERGLEEGVGHQVVDAGPVGAGADADEHEAELRHRRVGQHLLDVVLEEPDGGGEDGGERADQRHPAHGAGREHEEEVEPGHHVDAGRDHGGGVDEGRDRGRAGHGVGEPDVERELGRLAHGADEQQHADEREQRDAPAPWWWRGAPSRRSPR